MAELRFDPIDRQTIVIAPERSKRPKDDFNGSKDNSKKCPFCPGNEDQTPPENFNNGDNLKNWTIRSFPNKYPAFSQSDNGNLYGIQDVIVESDKHDINMGEFSAGHFKEIIRVYKRRIESIRADKSIRYIVLFKNHGVMAGATLKHPHSQIAGLSFVPRQIKQRIKKLKKYYEKHNNCYYCDLIKNQEKISENNSCVLITPNAARFSYESWILPKSHQQYFEEISEEQLADLTAIFLGLLQALNKTLNNPDFNMVLNNGIYKKNYDNLFHWNIQLIPRIAYQAGFECATGMFINQVEPERAVQLLKQHTLVV